MNEKHLLDAVLDSAPTAQTVAAAGIVWLSWRVRVVETRLATIANTINGCPTCKRHIPVASVLLLGAFLLTGCQGAGLSVRLGIDLPPSTNTPALRATPLATNTVDRSGALPRKP